MKKTESDKPRLFYSAVVMNLVRLYGTCCRLAMATMCFYALSIMIGLLGADPETTTFKTFLLAVQAPSVWVFSLLLAVTWRMGVVICTGATWPFMHRTWTVGHGSKAAGSATNEKGKSSL